MENEQIMYKVCQHRNVPEAFERFQVPTSGKWLQDAMRAPRVRNSRSAFFEVQSAGCALFSGVRSSVQSRVQDARSAFFRSVTSMWPGTWVMQSGNRASSATD